MPNANGIRYKKKNQNAVEMSAYTFRYVQEDMFDFGKTIKATNQKQFLFAPIKTIIIRDPCFYCHSYVNMTTVSEAKSFTMFGIYLANYSSILF